MFDTRKTGSGARDLTRCLVAGTCAGFRELLDLLAGSGAAEFVQLADLSPGAEQSISAVLLATDGSSDWTHELGRVRERTDAAVLLVSPSASTQMLDAALEAGVEDVLVLPEPPENVLFAIRRASRHQRQTRVDLPSAQGRIVTVFSPKGGVGKTVISTNLGVTLAKHLRKRTLLVDLDLQFGDAAILLGVQPERTLSELVAAPGEVNAEKLEVYVSKHPSGLDILAAPLRPESSEAVTDEELARVLEVARDTYDAVVIDTAPLFHGPVLTAIDCTDTLLLVCSPDVASLKNVHLSLRTLSLLSFPGERLQVVLNAAHAGDGLRRSEVENALGLTITTEIPYDKGVRTALNRGVPVTLSDTRSALSVTMRRLAESIVPGAAPAPTRRGGVRLLRTAQNA